MIEAGCKEATCFYLKPVFSNQHNDAGNLTLRVTKILLVHCITTSYLRSLSLSS